MKFGKLATVQHGSFCERLTLTWPHDVQDMMRHPEHHHVPSSTMQRNARMGIQQMGPPPAQRSQPMLMSIQSTVPVPHSELRTLFFLTLFALPFISAQAMSLTDIQSVFHNKRCIEGVLVSMPSGPTLITTQSIPQQPQHSKANVPQVYNYDAAPNDTEPSEQSSSNASTISVPNGLANTKEKTPMCLVNELARYNKIQHQYRLTGEQGPAHKKLFTVTLKLGNEEYEAEGPSIKKAQHAAAAMALAKTEFKHPPPKSSRINRLGLRSSGMVTPTVELNALAMKRGERTEYILQNGAPAHHPQTYLSQPGYYPRHNIYGPGQPRYNYDPRRNHSARNHYPPYDSRYYGQYKTGYQHTSGEPFTVRLRVGDREYPGMGYTVQAARHDAAAKAIDDIKQLTVEDDSQCPVVTENEMNDIPSDINTELKSPISLVHEIALKRNLNVAFEVLNEKGPPHMKVFVTQCKVGDLIAEGEGNGKKISKKRAAEKMLEELTKLPPIPNMSTIALMKRKRVVNKKKNRNLIKMNMDKNSEYTEEINPISRLIQIQQANKEKEPAYAVLEERGAPRRREFVIEASVNGHSCTGVGPNKKIAKRNAADALLSVLGYAKNPQTPIAAPKPVLKEPEVVEKPRKVTFLEEKPEASIGGSSGRQLVPGLLLVSDQAAGFQQKNKVNSEIMNAAAGTSSDKKSGQTPVTKIPPPTTQGVRAKDQLLYLAQLLGVQVQFSDFPKANHEMYLTLVSLSTHPPQVCHGEGSTTEASHEKAALEALNVLSELGLDNVTPNKESNVESTHGPVKPQVIPKSGLNQNGVKK